MRTWGRIWRDFDWPLLLATLVVLTFGLLAIHSATRGSSGQADFRRQLLNLVPASACLVGLVLAGYRWLKNKAYFVYGFTLLLLLIVLFTGHSALGAQRWINLGFMTIQPSEYAKMGVIIMLSRWLSDKNVHSPEGFLGALMLVGFPALLVFKQPDLGTSLVFGALTLGMLYWSGISGESIFKLVSPLISLILRLFGLPYWICFLLGFGTWLFWKRGTRWQAPLAIWTSNLVVGGVGPFLAHLLKEYQRKRLTIFLNPESDPRGAGYHIIQSKIAIGSGGLWGKGLFHGTQTQLHFIPEQHTDFIFSAIGEELGFAGCLIVLVAFIVIVFRGIRIAEQAERAGDRFAALLAIGITTMLLFHLAINVGMATGVMPVTGIPLPLVSYGGSALLTNLAAIGLLESIAMRQRKIFF